MEKSLVLTGMMGVGKSTIGRLLAKKLRFKFIDVDRLIERQEKKKNETYSSNAILRTNDQKKLLLLYFEFTHNVAKVLRFLTSFFPP